ncbi:TIGR03086 family metal-binding protein [soil metagenome]
MSETHDLRPVARALADVIASVDDDRLAGPTPCPDYTVGDLLDHVAGLSVAFTAAATKESLPAGASGPSGDASRLDDDWRTTIPTRLHVLAGAWQEPDAWTGMTVAGPVEMPGEIAGLVALNELVIHGWDVARAAGAVYEPDTDAVMACRDFVLQFSGPGSEEQRAGGFGPVVTPPAGATPLEELIAISGRDPNWTPS